MQSDIVKIESFTRLPLIFFKSLGVRPFKVSGIEPPLTRIRNCLEWIFCLLSWGNLWLVVLGEMYYFTLAIGRPDNFVELCEVLLCIGYIFLSFAKMGTLILQRKKTNRITAELYDMFPRTMSQQEDYEAVTYAKRTILMMTVYASIQMFMIWLFNLNPMVDAVVGWFYGIGWQLAFPYVVWYPFNAWAPGWFELNYISQFWAAYVSAAGILAADLLLCSFSIQVCMHFDRLHRTILQMRPNDDDGELAVRKDYVKLSDCMSMHSRILRYIC